MKVLHRKILLGDEFISNSEAFPFLREKRVFGGKRKTFRAVRAKKKKFRFEF